MIKSTYCTSQAELNRFKIYASAKPDGPTRFDKMFIANTQSNINLAKKVKS